MKVKPIKWDGYKIKKSGVYSNMPLDAYHNPDICEGPSISSSGLRKLNPDTGSPAHFYANWAGNPNRTEQEDKRHFIVGRALHHLVLGEPFFAKLFCSQPEEYEDAKTGELKKWNNNANVCRAWHEARRKEGRLALSANEVEIIRQMAHSVGNNPLTKTGIFNGYIEHSIFWRDEETGIWLKWRPDSIPTDSADFGDLKTAHSIFLKDIVSAIREHGYYQQVALGRWACREVLGAEMGEFRYLFVEKKDPWCTVDIEVEQEDIVRGERMNRACLRIFAKCLKDNRWPGPYEGSEGNMRAGLSDDAREQIDKRLRYEGLADGED